jgi:polysaccharide pyruvyl transferase WcaK-like protein
VADIAFLLKPALASESRAVAWVKDWTAQQRQSNQCFIIACNLNPQPLIRAGGRQADLVQAYVEAFKQLWRSLGPTFSVLIVPHDYRPQHHELEACQAFHQMLPADLRARTLLLSDPLGAAEVKAVTALCDVVMTGRMHMAIAALGSGKPAACISYLSKFEGMLAFFGLEELALKWQEAVIPGKLAAWAAHIISRRHELTNRVELNLPKVQELSRANLDFSPPNFAGNRSAPSSVLNISLDTKA